MHHVHISTWSLFVMALFVLGIIGLGVWVFVDRRRQQERREQREAQLMADEMRSRQPSYGTAAPATAAPGNCALHATGSISPAPAVSTTVIVQDTSNDFLSGVIMGEMLARPPAYMPYEPGPTVFVPDTSATCPASPPSGGGLDFSWGSDSGDGGSSCDTGSSDTGSSSDW